MNTLPQLSQQRAWLTDHLSDALTGFPAWFPPMTAHPLRLGEEISDGHYLQRADADADADAIKANHDNRIPTVDVAVPEVAAPRVKHIEAAGRK